MSLAILIVTYNSEATIDKVLTRIKEENLDCSVFVFDNASSDTTKEILARYPEVSFVESEKNLGFCAANNFLLNRSYKLLFSHFLFLNPDAAPTPGALKILMELALGSQIGAFTPKILRAGSNMELLSERVIDAAGMYFTKNFRHLDRGSGELDTGQYNKQEEVSGGTGAALLVTRFFVEKVSFLTDQNECEFFDNRFFAYREDAELALRAHRYGLKYLYVPDAVFYHVRKVLPERRNNLSPFINALSVRNRFLLLLSHYTFSLPISVQLHTLLRNLLVFGYAVIFEKESRIRLFEEFTRIKMHLARRKEIVSKSKNSLSKVFS